MHARILSFLLLLMLSFKAEASSSGKVCWLAYMENLTLAFNGPPAFSVIISSQQNTSGQVEIPATGLSIPFTVIANQPTEVYLPGSIFYPQGDEAIANVGIKISANDTIDVYAYHHRNYFSDATMVVSNEELGSDYVIMAKSDDRAISPSEFVILATEDSTTLKIIPSVITLSARPPGVAFTVVLNKGQVYQLQSMSDLSGTVVTSLNPSKKIAVFGGARQAYIHCNSGADSHIYDVNFPSMFGNKFVVVPTLNLGGDPIKIMCNHDSTYVTIDNGTPFLLATKGSYADTFISAATYITSTKPVAIAQFIKSLDCNPGATADPSMLVLTPVDMMRTKAVFKSVTGPPAAVSLYTPSHFTNIVIKTTQEDSVYLDGMSVTGFQVLSGNAQFSYKQLAIDSGNHILSHAYGFNAFAYGTGYANAYTYHLGFQSNNTSTSLNDIRTLTPSVVFPNPFNDYTTITLSSSDSYQKNELLVYTIEGKLVYSKLFQGNKTILNRGNVSNGLYYYTIRNSDRIISKGKISIQ